MCSHDVLKKFTVSDAVTCIQTSYNIHVDFARNLLLVSVKMMIGYIQRKEADACEENVDRYIFSVKSFTRNVSPGKLIPVPIFSVCDCEGEYEYEYEYESVNC